MIPEVSSNTSGDSIAESNEDFEKEVNSAKDTLLADAEAEIPEASPMFDGTISSVTNFGMFVRLPNLIEGLVAMRDMTDDYYIYDEDNMCLIGRSKHKKYKLGSKIKVKCVNASKESKQVDFIVSSDKINTGNSKGRKKNGRPIKGQTRRARKGGSHAKKR